MGRVKYAISLIVLLFSFLGGQLSASEADPVTEEDKAFFLSLRQAIINDDRQWVVQHLFLVSGVYVKGRYVPAVSKKFFLKNYDSIINDDVKTAILSQDANKLFKNSEGLMVGERGELWFALLGYRERPETLHYAILAIHNDYDAWLRDTEKRLGKKK